MYCFGLIIIIIPIPYARWSNIYQFLLPCNRSNSGIITVEKKLYIWRQIIVNEFDPNKTKQDQNLQRNIIPNQGN